MEMLTKTVDAIDDVVPPAHDTNFEGFDLHVFPRSFFLQCTLVLWVSASCGLWNRGWESYGRMK
jgi:hypothetical protein